MFILKNKFEYNKYLLYVKHHSGINGFVLSYLILGVDSLSANLCLPWQGGSEVASVMQKIQPGGLVWSFKKAIQEIIQFLHLCVFCAVIQSYKMLPL